MMQSDQRETESISCTDDEFAIWATIKHGLELKGITLSALAGIHNVNRTNFVSRQTSALPKIRKDHRRAVRRSALGSVAPSLQQGSRARQEYLYVIVIRNLQSIVSKRCVNAIK